MNEEVTGQNMTAFTARLWVLLEEYAANPFRYNLSYDRNKKPTQAAADTTTTAVCCFALHLTLIQKTSGSRSAC